MIKNNLTDEAKIAIINNVKAWYSTNGRVPKKEDFKKINNLPSIHSVIKYFENFTNLLTACSLPLHKARATTDEEKVEQIKNKCTILDDCWVWTGSISESGYGQVRYKTKCWKTHDLVGRIYYKIIDKKDKVWHHKCENRKCCNPDHLELVSKSDNIKFSHKVARPYNKRSMYNNITIENILTEIESCCAINNTCWEYTGKISSMGYPIKSIGGVSYTLTKLILAKTIGIDYDKIDITGHKCDNRKCCNPEHLYHSNNSQNQIDARSYSKSTKLTIESVKEIKKELLTADLAVKGAKTSFDSKWAKELGVHPRTIASIRCLKSWKDV
jgi:hypothetical protein